MRCIFSLIVLYSKIEKKIDYSYTIPLISQACVLGNLL